MIILCILCIGYSNVSGQFVHPIKVKAGEDIFEKLGDNIFLYPNFIPGLVVFKNNVVNQSSFNYNLLYGALQFINPKGDTLSILNPDSIKYVKISLDTFFYDQGYLQLITSNQNVKLAVKQVIKIIDQEKLGAYGGTASTGAVTSYSEFATDFQNFKLDLRRDITFDKMVSFYVAGKDGNFFKANKKNLLKAFPRKQKELDNFIKNNNTNFNRAADMINVVSFLKD